MEEQLIILAVQLAIKYGPTAAQEFITLFHKQDATPADWISYFDRVKPFEFYLAAAKARAATGPTFIPPSFVPPGLASFTPSPAGA